MARVDRQQNWCLSCPAPLQTASRRCPSLGHPPSVTRCTSTCKCFGEFKRQAGSAEAGVINHYRAVLNIQQLFSWCSPEHDASGAGLFRLHPLRASAGKYHLRSFVYSAAGEKHCILLQCDSHRYPHKSHDVTKVTPTGAHRSGDHALAGDGGGRARAAGCIVLCTTSWHALSAARSNHRVRRWRSPGAGAPGRHMQELCQWTQPV